MGCAEVEVAFACRLGQKVYNSGKEEKHTKTRWLVVVWRLGVICGVAPGGANDGGRRLATVGDVWRQLQLGIRVVTPKPIGTQDEPETPHSSNALHTIERRLHKGEITPRKGSGRLEKLWRKHQRRRCF